MLSFTRARIPEQKETRRAHVLATARALLQSGTPLYDLGLNELARHAKMTKSNLYRYFESREHVLIELLRDEWVTWFTAMTTTWKAPSKNRVAYLAAHMGKTLSEHALVCELTSALPSVLERNLSEEAILAFKKETLSFFREAATFISARVPELDHAAAMQLMHDGAALITGLWPHTHPAPAVARAIASDKELCTFARDFRTDLTRLLHAAATATTT